MPKNQKKESKKRFFKNKKHEFVIADDLQQYARVDNKLGDGRFNLYCFTTNNYIMGTIRGGIKKFTWIETEDIVLISLREFDNKKCDIIHKYNINEIKKLQEYTEIPTNINKIENYKEENDNIFDLLDIVDFNII